MSAVSAVSAAVGGRGVVAAAVADGVRTASAASAANVAAGGAEVVAGADVDRVAMSLNHPMWRATTRAR